MGATKKSATGQPAQAEHQRVSAGQIALLIEIAALAIQDFQAQAAVAEAHGIYIDAINRAEAKFGRVDGRLDPLNPDHSHIILATASEYKARQRARKTAYNVRRRLQTACRRSVRINAQAGGAIPCPSRRLPC
jgi:hypothetical protein